MEKIEYHIHPALTLPFDDLYKGLQEEVEAGYINVQTKDDLELFNYSATATYDKHWNIFTLVARGLILCPSQKKVVAAPFPKFFNYGEVEEDLPDLGFSTTLKMDGSLGIVYFWNGKWNVATRGSFASDQAVWAEKNLQSYMLDYMHENATYLVEIIYTQNRIVVTYDFEGLVLLGGYFVDTGHELQREILEATSRETGMGLTETAHFDSLDDMLGVCKTLSYNEEGFVVRFTNGYRIKIKGDEYCRLHRLVSNCTPLVIWDMMRNLDDLENAKKDLPEEFRKDFDAIESILNGKLDDLLTEVEEVYLSTKELGDKELGMYLQNPNNTIDPRVKRFVFPCRKRDFLETIRTGSKSKLRNSLFELFRPTGNVLEGCEPSTAMNRFEEEK